MKQGVGGLSDIKFKICINIKILVSRTKQEITGRRESQIN